MKILSLDTVAIVQGRFQTRYPMLQIQFYRVAHDHFSGSQQKDQVAPSTLLNTLNPELADTEVVLQDGMTVDTLETYFEEKLDLHVQVFRKSGEHWMQTSATDHWTLAKHMQVASETEAFVTNIRR